MFRCNKGKGNSVISKSTIMTKATLTISTTAATTATIIGSCQTHSQCYYLFMETVNEALIHFQSVLSFRYAKVKHINTLDISKKKTISNQSK